MLQQSQDTLQETNYEKALIKAQKCFFFSTLIYLAAMFREVAHVLDGR